MKNFIGFFVAGCIGAILYKAVMYIANPYPLHWKALAIQLITISMIVAVILVLIRWVLGTPDKS